ncbi:MAG: L7Ae/L30e/S12e/Gadd45 family ribosomal protein [Acutalibacteraceae bacterium]|nr:ribosomal L7Ae/L30e/S12e/Gadd45 family protein [Bacillota bacterium]
MNDRLLSLLGIARKAGKLVFGRDRAAEAIAQKQAKLLLVSEDLSPKSKKEMQFLCENAEVPFVQVAYTMAQLSAATGARAGIYVVVDEGFAGALKALQP